VSEDQWGDLDCLYKTCQAAITDGGLFTYTGRPVLLISDELWQLHILYVLGIRHAIVGINEKQLTALLPSKLENEIHR